MSNKSRTARRKQKRDNEPWYWVIVDVVVGVFEFIGMVIVSIFKD